VEGVPLTGHFNIGIACRSSIRKTMITAASAVMTDIPT
jgi:hypothetical protein